MSVLQPRADRTAHLTQATQDNQRGLTVQDHIENDMSGPFDETDFSRALVKFAFNPSTLLVGTRVW